MVGDVLRASDTSGPHHAGITRTHADLYRWTRDIQAAVLARAPPPPPPLRAADVSDKICIGFSV